MNATVTDPALAGAARQPTTPPTQQATPPSPADQLTGLGGMSLGDALQPATASNQQPGGGPPQGQQAPRGMSLDEALTPREPSMYEKVTSPSSDQEYDAHLISVTGAAEAALRLGANAVPEAINGALDFAHRNLLPPSMGGGGAYKPLPTFGVGAFGESETQFWQSYVDAYKELPGNQQLTAAAKASYAAVDQMLGNGALRQVLSNSAASVGDVFSMIPGYAAGREAAGILAARSASAEAMRAQPVWRILNFSSPDAAAAEVLGFRTGRGRGMAMEAVGPDSMARLTNSNIDVGNIVAHHVSGVPFDSYLSPDTIKAAMKAPQAVMDRAAAGLRAGPLDRDARDAIRAAGNEVRISSGSPNVQKQLDALRSELLDETAQHTGRQVMGELKALRQEAFHTLNKSEDIDAIALAKAKLKMADAIEGHIDRNLTGASGTNRDQIRAARQSMAQALAVREALQGNDLDLGALGRMYSRSDHRFSGPLRTAAIFAENNRAFTGARIPLHAPTLRTAVSGRFNVMEPGTWSRIAALTGIPQRRLMAGGGTALARRMLPGRDPNMFKPLPTRPEPVDPAVVRRAFSRTREEPNAPGGAAPRPMPQPFEGAPPREGQLPERISRYAQELYGGMDSDF